MGFLGVQGEDAKGQLLIRHQQGRHGPHAETPGGLEAMAAIRRPEAVFRWNRDHRIEEDPGRANCIHQAGGVGPGQVPLEGRRDDLLEG